MQALIEKDATAFTLPGRAPAAAGVIGLCSIPVGDHPDDTRNLAQMPFPDQLLNLEIAGFGPELNHSSKDLARVFLCGLNQTLRIGFVRRDRLLHHDVETSLKSGDAERGVLVMRRGDNHRS